MPSKEFHEKLIAKMQEQMGELMTPDEMRPIIAEAVQKAFFERRIELDQWRSIRTDLPPIFVEMMTQRLNEAVNAQVDAYLVANPTVLQDAVTKVIEEGLMSVVVRVFESRTSSALFTLGEALAKSQRELMQRGLLNP